MVNIPDEGSLYFANDNVRLELSSENENSFLEVDFKAGGIGIMHKHYHSQVTYVKSGEFQMTIGDEVRTIKGGDSYYIPPHVMHGCTCTKPGILIDVFSPHREDFLEK